MAGVTVAAPVRTPHRYGLFSAASIVDATDMHELMGVQWQPLPCGRPGLFVEDCLPTGGGNPDVPATTEKDFADQPGTVEASPITVYGSFRCRLLGYSLEEAQRRAREHLEAGEQQAVEYAVMSGEGGNLPFLADADTVNLGTATCAEELLSLLYEHADAEFTGEPVLHVPRAAAPWLKDHLAREAGRLVTTLGTPVVAGAGYSEANVGPGGVAAPAGSFWVYATGPVVVRRGPITAVPNPPEAGLNRSNNDFTALAERQYVVGWDCLAAAVQFTPACCCG
ncbi:hypothetical protein [Amycolatopsis thermophila]|uniref:Uncharacterized protein n=1 Tax=Amycolatopsis thermophila TaxID=206084 RepID=A0ABU0EMJ7_9PSEU|nr:hypothetical protein [Amycolatopsis thermophila]MDQ0376499.1 hypothetical protein [Amycolatopsis thermophila]